MSTADIIKIALNIFGAAAAGYVGTGTWEGGAIAVTSSLVALFQHPPWR